MGVARLLFVAAAAVVAAETPRPRSERGYHTGLWALFLRLSTGNLVH